MAEDKNRIYLCDRWFYLIKETDTILKYASNPIKPTQGIILEKRKDDNSLQIFYYVKNKLFNKISVSDITEKEIFFHYKDLVPHLTNINGEEYVNLLADIFSHLKYGNRAESDKIYIKKKKNLRKLCYREPDFPLEVTIDLKDLSVANEGIQYYLNLVSNFKLYIPNVNEREKQDDMAKNITGEIRELNIPGELALFDRIYTFKEEELGRLYFYNDEDSITNLVINYDTIYRYIEGININFRETIGTKKFDCTYEAYRNEYNGMTVVFYNNIKENININQQKIEDSRYKFFAKYDESGNQVSNYLEIIAGRKRTVYYLHPVLSTIYIDDDGNTYQIGNQNFGRLKGMANFSNGIFKVLEKKLTK